MEELRRLLDQANDETHLLFNYLDSYDEIPAHDSLRNLVSKWADDSPLTFEWVCTLGGEVGKDWVDFPMHDGGATTYLRLHSIPDLWPEVWDGDCEHGSALCIPNFSTKGQFRLLCFALGISINS